MRQKQLEHVVFEAIRQARAKSPIEDDRIEFKRGWPKDDKARQLAGAANRANGNDLIYIIGADEDGVVFKLDSTDAADWWKQFERRFDAIPPDLENHINVVIDDGESVIALQFRTERAPYVVKCQGGGSPELEVPIRDGTRTRSATRTELLRMLLPQASVPPALLLSGDIKASGYSGGIGACVVEGSASVFLEHTAPSGSMLPYHEMTGTLEAEGHSLPLSIVLIPARETEMPLAFGVHARDDGVFVTGPGSFRFRFESRLDYSQQSFLRGVTEWQIRLRFGVVGSPRATEVEGMFAVSNTTPRAARTDSELGTWLLTGSRNVGGEQNRRTPQMPMRIR